MNQNTSCPTSLTVNFFSIVIGLNFSASIVWLVDVHELVGLKTTGGFGGGSLENVI